MNTQSTHEWLRGFHTTYKEVKADTFTVEEVYGADAALARTYTGDQLDECFEFELASGFVNSAIGGTTSGVYSALSFLLKALPDGQFETFLTNRDQDRVMSTLNGNVGHAKPSAIVLLTAPRTPFIYYGEVVSMQGTEPDEQIRSPMQWSADLNGGFSPEPP